MQFNQINENMKKHGMRWEQPQKWSSWSSNPEEDIESYNPSLVGGFNPSEKYESQLGLLFPIYGKITNVPNHQPGLYISDTPCVEYLPTFGAFLG